MAADPVARWGPREASYMRQALQEAQNAHDRYEVPVGCVVVRGDTVIGRGSNRTNEKRNATRHAELEAVDEILQTAGGDVASVSFSECELYVTCEPCIMCAGALSIINIGKVYYGCANDKFGGCGSVLPVNETGCGECWHSDESVGSGKITSTLEPFFKFPCVSGIMAEEAVELLRRFYVRGNANAPVPHRPLC
mmetsp:Transcript_31240/g.60268  ORF Transcript_31240/g.60268 Transcript_31240/m.60268 type:complete len:194 (-) Transcript_31240:1305-1886(-)|eukprot:CAMPEP_0114254808 /NCGR_PEP_ID=MMETSP0058-20121206/17202_1 /TAXON_ID=36894 /ORGANISM="Pyramimonas parkeae, CCMP726" /LENGTH=193 /DNA_ID=CAMNT_0001369103 /DNA_START=55 /DNA_END=636 /DNA_ORIENTATION=+